MNLQYNTQVFKVGGVKLDFEKKQLLWGFQTSHQIRFQMAGSLMK